MWGEGLNPGRPARKTIRFPLQVPVTFWWVNGNGKTRQGEGRSRDLSEHGAFVFAPVCPPVGTNVVLTIPLEGVPNEVGPIPVKVEGEVRRIEQVPDEGKEGFAIQY
jgi:hypothetical protein